MDAHEIRGVVVSVLTDIQSDSGRTVSDFSGDMCPMGGLDGFDSINCIEAAITLSGILGCDIQKDVALFTQDGHGRTMDEIVDDLCEIVGSSKQGV